MLSQFNGPLTRRLRARLDRLASDHRGAAAVEFALIAAPFFFLIFGLLEVCMIFILSTVLEHAVSEASRGVRTGQAQAADMDQAGFRNAICEKVFDLLDCDNKLHIDVRTLSGFSSAGNAGVPLTSSNTFDDTGFSFQPGGPNDVVAVRVFYEWNLITPVMSTPLSNMAGNKHLLQANAVFRNEPFQAAP